MLHSPHPKSWPAVRDQARGGHPTRLSGWQTPVLAFDRAASDRNVDLMMSWVGRRGLTLAPHGKTTMAPELWHRLLSAGAWGITFATMWQVQVAYRAGVRRVILANQLVDPVAITWLIDVLDVDPGFEFLCWVDSPDGVGILAAAARSRPIDVLIEIGGPGGRSGVRDLEAAEELALCVAREPRLRLRGVAGYEGSYGSERSTEGTNRVRAYVRTVRRAFDILDLAGILIEPVVSMGGSAWFDLVADELASLGGRARIILRAGAFQAHDALHYARVSPLAFSAAVHVWARVISNPEPSLVILDAGKRDLPYDIDLPVVERTLAGQVVTGARVRKLDDQHAYVDVSSDAALAIGDVVRLGVSHPCGVFDRWQAIPEIASADHIDPEVVGVIETAF